MWKLLILELVLVLVLVVVLVLVLVWYWYWYSVGILKQVIGLGLLASPRIPTMALVGVRAGVVYGLSCSPDRKQLAASNCALRGACNRLRCNPPTLQAAQL